jgi:hypothetical protein
MLKRAMILLGLMAFVLSTSGAASALHHAIEHAEPESSCHSSDEHPGPDRDDAPGEPEDCDLCLTLGAARDALPDLDAPLAVEPTAWAFAGPPLEGMFIPGVSFTTGPPRAPPFAA